MGQNCCNTSLRTPKLILKLPVFDRVASPVEKRPDPNSVSDLEEKKTEFSDTERKVSL